MMKHGQKPSGGTTNISRAKFVMRKMVDEANVANDSTDPRFVNLGKGPTVSRKAKRKEVKMAKKARKRAYNSKKAVDMDDSLEPKTVGIFPKAKRDEAAKMSFQEREEAEERREKRQIKKGMKKAEKNKQILRKNDLLAANEIEDQNIRRLEKSLRFRKKKKTKETILPGHFKYDGLDYLLDIVDSKKLAKLKDAAELDGVPDVDRDAAGLGEKGEMDRACNEDGSDEDEDSDFGPGEFDEDPDEDRPAANKRPMDGEARVGRIVDGDDFSEDDDDGSDQYDDGVEVVNKEHGGVDGRDSSRYSIANSKRRRADNERGGLKKPESNETDSMDDESDRDSSDGSPDKDSVTATEESAPKMDPYGNLVGQVTRDDTSSTYVPPHKRARMMGETIDGRRKAELEKLKRQLKGLLNRLIVANVQSISRDIAELYQTKSRNDMNETLCNLLQESLIIKTISTERLVMELVLLVTILHFNIGSEVGAHFLQSMAIKFDQLHKGLSETGAESKECDNVVLILVHLYNFKIVHCCLMYDVIRRLVESFTERDVEMLLLLLKSAGMSLRKDDPLALKEIILQIQAKAATCSDEFRQHSRVKFMLETIGALRNNDMRKMTNNNNEHLESLRKILKNATKSRDNSIESNLRISLEDLLLSEDKGRWWIVGSAWRGRGPNRTDDGKKTATDDLIPALKMDQSTSKRIMELSRRQRMNTDIRRNIFGLVMTAEDYEDCVEKLLHLGLKSKQEKEIVLVVIDCCQQERRYNPYYSHVLTKLCLFDRKFKIACQFAYWDRFRIMDQVSKSQAHNLAALLAHLLLHKAMSLSVLKIIEFADITKNMAVFLKKLLMTILEQNPERIGAVFGSTAGVGKLEHLRATLSLFLHHFVLKQRGSRTDEEHRALKEKIAVAERSLRGDPDIGP